MKKFKKLICLILTFSIVFASVAAFANGVGISSYIDGNEAASTFTDGIFTAVSSGSDKFFIALYKDNELIKLERTDTPESLSEYKLNMVIDNTGADTLKVFRWDFEGEPLCVNTVLTKTANPNYRVHLNENFDDGTTRFDVPDGTNIVIQNGCLRYNSPVNKYFMINNTSRYLVIQADYKLPKDTNINLIVNYTGSMQPFVKSTSLGIETGAGVLVKSASELDYNDFINIAVLVDLESRKYSIYVDEVNVKSNINLGNIIKNSGEYTQNKLSIRPAGGFTLANGDMILVDNVKAYSSESPVAVGLDLGDSIPNAHVTDFSAAYLDSDIYERPSYMEIADAVIGNGHPRVMLNADRVSELKTSNDLTIQGWKDTILQRAEACLDEAVYNYRTMSNANDFDPPIERMMTLGLGYLLTDGYEYAARAETEAIALIDQCPSWGAKAALNASKLAFALSICYDWMYSGLSEECKAVIRESVIAERIEPAYKMYNSQAHNMDSQGIWSTTNNFNAVNNGSSFITAMAFMDDDAYRAAIIAESSLRAMELLMTSILGDGSGWDEGLGYWKFALNYLTAAIATLEANMGDKEVGGYNNLINLHKTQMYGVGMDGKYGWFNIGDTGAADTRADAAFMYFWSRIFNDSDITSAMLKNKTKYNIAPTPYDLVYYTPSMYDDSYEFPEAHYFDGTEVVSLLSGAEADDTYLAISGGKGAAVSHDHLDSGAVLLDMKGERLFWDIGAEHYDAYGIFSGSRYKYFRCRPEGHNIFVINHNPSEASSGTYYGQDKDAVSTITSDTANLETSKTATMNLSEAYARDAESANRTISLNGDKAIITDNITLLQEGSTVKWNWYLKNNVGNVRVDNTNKTVTVTQNGKTFTVSFNTTANISISASQLPARNSDDLNISGVNSKYHSNSSFTRLSVEIADASGNISLTTTVE